MNLYSYITEEDTFKGILDRYEKDINSSVHLLKESIIDIIIGLIDGFN
jgi:hypothetical protein